MKRFADFTIVDFEMLVRLPEHSSLREVAAALDMDPAKVSRRVADIEQRLGTKLLTRSNMGVVVTQDGHHVAVQARRVLSSLKEFDVARRIESQPQYEEFVTIGARGFLNAHVGAATYRALSQGLSDRMGIRFLDQSPDESRSAAKQGTVDVVIGIEAEGLGKAWTSSLVGELRWRLYANARHPLTMGGTLADLRNYRIAHHCYWNGQRIQSSTGVLESLGLGHTGYGTETAATAMALLQVSDHVVCAPSLVARDLVASGQIAELQIEGVDETCTPLHLALHQDRISAATQKRLRRELSSACAE